MTLMLLNKLKRKASCQVMVSGKDLIDYLPETLKVEEILLGSSLMTKTQWTDYKTKLIH